MFKILVFAVGLSCLGKSCGLICYTSDFNGYLSSNETENLNYQLQDCNEYIKNIPKTDSALDSVHHCYTIGTDYPDVVLKGCFPRNSCQDLKMSFMKIIETKKVPIDIMGNIQCKECENDGCNLDNDLFFPTQRPSPAPNTTTSIKALSCYYCPTPCNASIAQTKTCELYEDGVCSLETSKDDQSLAIRRCQNVSKDSKPECSLNSWCWFCNQNLCNLERTTSTAPNAFPSIPLLSISFVVRHFVANKS